MRTNSTRLWLRLLIVAAVAALSAWTIYPPDKTIKLGLDLKGGAHLVLRVKTDDAATVEQAQRTIERRVNEMGVAESAVARYGEDSLQRYGIVPWWTLLMHRRLTGAFKERDGAQILKLSAEIGHYLADLHVPLHASSNHNGQLTGQAGIHGFWESRIPELLAERE